MGLSSAYSFLQTDRGYVGLSSYEQIMITKIDMFTANGTWTVPAGVTYAVAHIRAGGGGVGTTTGGAGGNSSVAFAGGTITATGGEGAKGLHTSDTTNTAGATNSGNGAFRNAQNAGYDFSVRAQNGAYIVAGGDVTPAASITVTVGAGGTAGTNGAAGGSGYVWIEYQVKA